MFSASLPHFGPTILVATMTMTTLVNTCWGDPGSLQDVCPTAMAAESNGFIFINGYPCKRPEEITASDFKSAKLSIKGDTDNYHRSAVNMVTAAEYAGLNTQGLSVARTDLAVDGMVMPHSHPRASEIMFVSNGVVRAGFADTRNQLFQTLLKEGDVFVFPKGLLHFYLNAGYEAALVYSVFNSQNPGVVRFSDAMFGTNLPPALHSLLLSRRVPSPSLFPLLRNFTTQ